MAPHCREGEEHSRVTDCPNGPRAALEEGPSAAQELGQAWGEALPRCARTGGGGERTTDLQGGLFCAAAQQAEVKAAGTHPVAHSCPAGNPGPHNSRPPPRLPCQCASAGHAPSGPNTPSPHSGRGAGRQLPLQAQVPQDGAVGRQQRIGAQPGVIQGEERDGSLHWGGGEGEA